MINVLAKKIVPKFRFLRRRNINTINLKRAYPNAKIAHDIKVIGDPKNIKLGVGCVIESGVTLNLEHGGVIILNKNVILRSGAIVATCGGNIEIGDNSGIQHYTVVYGHGGLTIGKYLWIAAQCVIIPANHGIVLCEQPIYNQPLSKIGIVIDDNVWVGAGSMILDGTHIESGTVIAAGSVVKNRTVKDGIYGGVPAKLLKMRHSEH